MILPRPRVTERLRSIVGLLGILAAVTGCNRVPAGRTSVDDVTVRGAKKIDDDDIREKIATSPSPKFLGLFRGVVYEYSVFDRNVLQRDLARVEAFYRSKGYYDAHARAGRVHVVDDQHVQVEILVEEGEPAHLRRVRVVGVDGLPAEIAREAHRAATRALREGRTFEEGDFDKAAEAVRRSLTDRGYAYAKVENEAQVDIVTKSVDVDLVVRPGELCVFGPVTIEGLGDLPAAPVRRALDIHEGTPYSETTIDAALQAVLDLGVFASVYVTPDLVEPPRPDHVVPVKVKVEPSRLRRVRLGGGIELDALKTDVHAIAGWEHRNLFGGLRSFGVTFRPGVVLYPTRINDLEAPNRLLPEARLRLELRQPGLFEPRTNGFIRPELNVQALLLDPNPPPNARVIGYAEGRNAIGLERTYWRLFGSISHNLQIAEPFAYVGSRDPTLDTLVISYPELVTSLDLRNDPVHPREGVYLRNTLQVAGGPFGGQADDVKVQPDVRAYVPLAKHVVLAMRGSVGFLLPRNYGDQVRDRRTSTFDPSAAQTRDHQLTFFRGFFSGGPTSNRGYPLRGVGPHDIVPFISPEVEAQRLGTVCGGEFDCRTPTGGFTLWEASTEVRFKVDGPLSAAIFCDASDVSPRTTNIRLTHLHLSCGSGARYETPVGPIRLDVGYRLPGLQVLGGLTPDERRPQTFPLGIPIAVSFGIGEAY